MSLSPGTTDDEAEAKAAFYLRMQARGIMDRAVLRAFELVPRRMFAPARYSQLVARDLAVPIGCGQTMIEPWLLARMVVALGVDRNHRLLEIGAGSGYATAILSHLAGEVLSFERYQTLATAAQERLAELEITNAAVVWGDGLSLPTRLAGFDRIIVHGCLGDDLEALSGRLSEAGVLVCARITPEGQALVRIETAADGLREEAICPSRLQTIVAGLAATL